MKIKQASEKGLQWFQSARFGMFIHWGLYSLLERGEWVMHNEGIPVSEYEPLATRFNPVKFNADEWVQIAADAGYKYIVITSRHHDGFSMYDTALSPYKVTNTPFKRDPLRELADACARRRDIKLGFYSSLLDWHHPAYRFRQESGTAWSDYIAFLHGQVKELCTQYGEVACVWFDGDWPQALLHEGNQYFAAGGSFEYEKLYGMIRELQPDAVIHNNRHAQPIPGEDIQGFEQDLPGDNTAGFNTVEIYGLPMEVCMTINNSWGVNAGDRNHKSAMRLVNILTRSASVGANFLLNVGPTALGEILPVHRQRLSLLGAWLRDNGEAIYGTQAGIIAPSEDGSSVSTWKGNAHYVHILHDLSDCVKVFNVPAQITRATLVKNGIPVDFDQQMDEVTLTVPSELRDPLSTVIRLE